MTIAVYASIYKRHTHSSHLAICSTTPDTLHNLLPLLSFTLVLKQKALNNNWVKQSFCLCPFCQYRDRNMGSTKSWLSNGYSEFPSNSRNLVLIKHLTYLPVLFIILYLKFLSSSPNYQQVLMFILFISSCSCRIFLDPFILNFFCPHQ